MRYFYYIESNEHSPLTWTGWIKETSVATAAEQAVKETHVSGQFRVLIGLAADNARVFEFMVRAEMKVTM